MKNNKISGNHLFVISSGLISGLIILGGNYFAELGLSLFEIVFWSAGPATVLLFILFLFNKNYRFQKKNFGLLLLYGLTFAFIWMTQFGAVILKIPVAVVVFLLYTQPLRTVILSRLLLKEKVTKLRLFSCVLVLIGIVFLINPFQAESLGNIVGILFALFAGLGLSFWVVLGGILSKCGNNPINSNFAGNLGGLVFSMIIFGVLGAFIPELFSVKVSFDFPVLVIVLLVLYSLFTQFLAQITYLKGVEKVPVMDAGVIMLLEPVSGALLAALFFGQALTWNVGIGALFILVANYLVIKLDNQQS